MNEFKVIKRLMTTEKGTMLAQYNKDRYKKGR